jgi:tRNA pseudouridine55 synthase
VDIAARPVTVYSFEILRTSSDAFDARVVCSAGTYVRSLVADLGDRLGCGAHVRHLRRTAIGALSVDDACAPEDLRASKIRSVEDVLAHLPRVDVDLEAAAAARNGRTIASTVEGEALVVGPQGAVGVFEGREGTLRPVTVLGGAS